MAKFEYSIRSKDETGQGVKPADDLRLIAYDD